MATSPARGPPAADARGHRGRARPHRLAGRRSTSSRRPARPTSPTRSAASRGSASTPSASAARSRSRCRAIPFSIRSIDELGLPDVVRKLAEEPRGIILVTGTTGSGKSTTLAAMIDHINSTRARHIVTLEDPIEYLHRDKQSIINQREVGNDTESFGRALRRVLRQDPDVILIGEMRDEETVRTALSAAETGHLVLSTRPHPRRHRDDQPDHRLLPAAPPAAGAGDARVDPARRDRAAAGPQRRRRRPGRGLRGPGRHRPRPGPDPQPRRRPARSPR